LKRKFTDRFDANVHNPLPEIITKSSVNQMKVTFIL